MYTNLAAIANGHPMKVRIAGQVTRAKARQTSLMPNVDQLVVIEVPLKRPATCIATYGKNIAVGIKDTVLVYACDTIEDMSRDVRCILELEFGFKVRRIELCEEFIMCSSGMECQIIQLNFDESEKPEIGNVSHMTGPVTIRSFFEHDALRLCSPDEKAKSAQKTELIEEVISQKCEKCSVKNNSSLVENSACEHCQTSEVSGKSDEQLGNCRKEEVVSKEVALVAESDPKLTESKRHLVVRQTPVDNCRSNSPPLPPPSLPSRRSATNLKETIGGGVELLGPVSGDLPTCAVNVEYEGEFQDLHALCYNYM